jgi:hypothetical protein
MSQVSQQSVQTPEDLDKFLTGGGAPTVNASSGATIGAIPDSDRVLILGLATDDSGSIDQSGLSSGVKEGVELCFKACSGIKGSDAHILWKGFNRTYFNGLVRSHNLEDKSLFHSFNPDHHETPLLSQLCIPMMKEIHDLAQKYSAQGIATTVALLIMTDGRASPGETNLSSEFVSLILPTDYIVGMGVSNSESEIKYFTDFFKSVSIKRTVSPKASATELRRAMNAFSQSVANL